MGMLTLLAAAWPLAGLSQPALESAADRQRLIVETIEDEQARDGPYSEELIGPLTALAVLYQEEGDDLLAAATFERVRQVVRANYGLHSLEQAPLIQQLIRYEEARGNAEAAWALEQDLLTLIARHAGDMRTVPILHEIADKRTELLSEYLAGEFPPQIVLGCYYSKHIYDIGDPRRHAAQSCHSGLSSVVIGSILDEAQLYYTEAIDTLLENERDSSDELRVLEGAVLRNSYRYRDYRRGAYGDGRRLLGRRLAGGSASSASALDQANSLVEFADWDIVFADDLPGPKDYSSVLALYERAYRRLVAEDVAQAWIDAIFSPRIPVVLPAFLPNPLVSKETPERSAFIDVSFDITRYGKSDDVEILDTTTNAPRAAERRLVRLIERGRFRPRVRDGRIAETSRVVVRYFVDDEAALVE